MCSREDCGAYPLYGVAPHECYWRKPGGFENSIGTSTLDSFAEWPENFFAELYPGEPFSSLETSACGVWVCPECHSGITPDGTLWSSSQVAIAISKSLDKAIRENVPSVDYEIRR